MLSISHRTFFGILTVFWAVINSVLSDSAVKDIDHPTKGLVKYSEYYFSERHRFDQHALEPKDYFLSVYNPYWLRIPRTGVTYDVYVQEMKLMEQDYHENVEQLTHHLSIQVNRLIDSDLKTIVPLNSSNYYFRTRPVFCDLNVKFMEVLAKKRCVKFLAGEELISATDLEHEETIRSTRNKIYSDQQYTAEYEDELTETVPISSRNKVKPLSFESFSVIKMLIEMFPKQDDAPSVYSEKHTQLLKLMMEINPKARAEYLKSPSLYKIEPLSEERIHLLKSPTVLKDESYFYYMLRMRNLNLIAFYYQFGKEKFDGFGDSSEDEIIEAPNNNIVQSNLQTQQSDQGQGQ